MLYVEAEIWLSVNTSLTNSDCFGRRLGIGGNPLEGFGKKLPGSVTDGINSSIPCANRNEAFDLRLKRSDRICLFAPNFGSLMLDLLGGVVRSQAPVAIRTVPNFDKLEEASRRGSSQCCFPYRRFAWVFARHGIASQECDAACLLPLCTNKPGVGIR